MANDIYYLHDKFIPNMAFLYREIIKSNFIRGN